MNSYCNPDISYDAAENADLESTYYGAFKKYVMPYLDHCYATGLPTAQFDSHADTPPLPLTEPLAAFVDIEEVGMRGGTGNPSTLPTGKRSAGNNSLVKNSGHNNSSSTNTVISNNGGGDTEVDPYEGSVTRCICDFQHDDGYMICCDRCGVWQHVECMGVDGKHIPDSYLCELCYPRLVDKRRAVRIQSKKKEELEMEESSGSADDSLEEESRRPRRRGGRRRDQGRRKNTERSDSGGFQRKSQQRRKRTSSEMEGKKHSDGVLSPAKDQKRLRPQSFTGFGMDGSDAWDLNSPLEKEVDARQFGTGAIGGASIQSNTYSAEVLNLLVMKVKTMGASNASNVIAITQQLSKKCFKVVTYEDNSKGLEALEMIKPNHTVAEYTGKTVMRREYERNQSDLSYPFAVCYMGINGVELCVDSNDFNNEAKFVRRSCTPNAKVVHLLEKTGLRFFICATKTIPCGKEITIPFYFDYQRSTVELKCPCGKFNCMVAKHFKRMTGGRSSSTTSVTTAAPVLTTVASSVAISAAMISNQQRPTRQSKKRALDEFTDGAEDEDEDEMPQTSIPDRCSTGVLGQGSPTKRRNVGEVPEQTQQLETRNATSGRTVKFPRGKAASQQTQSGSTGNIGSEKGSFLASMLQAHLARNSNISKTSLAPMGASVSDDIALLNKLSSVGPIHLASSRSELSETTDVTKGKPRDSESSEADHQNHHQLHVPERFDESSQIMKKKQLLPQTKDMNIESETKSSEDSGSDTRVPSNVHFEGGGDKAGPKEKRKNSKLLAEIQTFFGSDRLGDSNDQGEKKVSTREQRKIEAAERRFERIEKNSARSSSRGATPNTASNQKLTKTRSGQQEDRAKKNDETIQKSSLKGTAVRSSKSAIAKNSVGKPQKPEDKSPTRQQSDRRHASTDTKKSIKATVAPSRTTRSSRK